MELIIKGRIHKYGDNIDTDAIIPGKFLKEMDPKVLAQHAMEGIDPDFVRKVREGDIIMAGRNFGCGSSREHAPLALRYAGIKAVLAISFARIFYRNAVNGGHLIPVEIDEHVYREIQDGASVELDLNEMVLKDLTSGKIYKLKPVPEMVLKILRAGGIFRYKHDDS